MYDALLRNTSEKKLSCRQPILNGSPFTFASSLQIEKQVATDNVY